MAREKGVNIKKNIGRPLKGDEKRNKSLHLRISETELQILNECSKTLNLTRTDTIYQGLQLLQEKMLKNKD